MWTVEPGSCFYAAAILRLCSIALLPPTTTCSGFLCTFWQYINIDDHFLDICQTSSLNLQFSEYFHFREEEIIEVRDEAVTELWVDTARWIIQTIRGFLLSRLSVPAKRSYLPWREQGKEFLFIANGE